MPVLDRDTVPMLAMHLLPLLGVWLAGWDAGNLLILYWLESAVIGLWTVVLMLAAREQPLPILSNAGQTATTGLTMALFVLMHGGFFMGIHLYFLHFAFEVTNVQEHGSLPASILHMVLEDGLWLPLAGLFVIRMLVTVQALQRREPVQRQIIGFYFRIVVMQIAIILGGFLLVLTGTMGALLMLVLVRLGFELAVPQAEDYVERHVERQRKAG